MPLIDFTLSLFTIDTICELYETHVSGWCEEQLARCYLDGYLDYLGPRGFCRLPEKLFSLCVQLNQKYLINQAGSNLIVRVAPYYQLCSPPVYDSDRELGLTFGKVFALNKK